MPREFPFYKKFGLRHVVYAAVVEIHDPARLRAPQAQVVRALFSPSRVLWGCKAAPRVDDPRRAC